METTKTYYFTVGHLTLWPYLWVRTHILIVDNDKTIDDVGNELMKKFIEEHQLEGQEDSIFYKAYEALDGEPFAWSKNMSFLKSFSRGNYISYNEKK